MPARLIAILNSSCSAALKPILLALLPSSRARRSSLWSNHPCCVPVALFPGVSSAPVRAACPCDVTATGSFFERWRIIPQSTVRAGRCARSKAVPNPARPPPAATCASCPHTPSTTTSFRSNHYTLIRMPLLIVTMIPAGQKHLQTL